MRFWHFAAMDRRLPLADSPSRPKDRFKSAEKGLRETGRGDARAAWW